MWSGEKAIRSNLGSPNPYCLPRACTLTLSAGNATEVRIHVRQLGQEPQLSIFPSKPNDVITFYPDGRSDCAPLLVKTNYPSWDYTLTPADGAGWLSAERRDDMPDFLFLTASSDATGEREEVLLTIRAGETLVAQNHICFIKSLPPYKTDDRGAYYAVSKPDHLLYIYSQVVYSGKDFSGVRFVQTADIDMGNKPFAPIGNYPDRPFSGDYEGAGFGISNLRVALERDCAGLFGYAKGGNLENIRIVSGSISGRDNVGGIAGCGSPRLANCHNHATVVGRNYVGGIIGMGAKAAEGQIDFCSNSGSVSGTGYYVGGIVGSAKDKDYRPSFYTNITACCNKAAVSGTDYVGGIAGEDGLYTTHCYNTGKVSGTGAGACAGGIIGYGGFRVQGCYNTGSVTGAIGTTGYIVGHTSTTMNNTVRNCFYLDDESGIPPVNDAWLGEGEAYAFGPSSWPQPGSSLQPDSRHEWTVYTDNPNFGCWKSLGHWVGGGTPVGSGSEFPKLFFEE